MHRREGQLIVSATDLVGFLECGHLTALDRAVADGLIDRPFHKDATLDLIRDRGGRHEGRYIEQLEREGRTITRLDGDRRRPYEERAAETVAAMRRGDDVIYQATVFDAMWVGHPDFLLRVDGASALGSYHYEVADTKLAHTAKASALIQICSYVDQVARIQEVRPERVCVVTGGAEIGLHEFRTAEMMAFYRHSKARFEEALRAGLDYTVSYPEPVEHCAVCRWKTTCDRRWHDDDGLPIVAGISRSQRTALRELSITTRGGLAVAQALDEKFDRVRAQARVQVESDGRTPPVWELLDPELDAEGRALADRGLSALPQPDAGDLFFDIEGDPFAYWEGLEYLFGIWEGSTGEGLWDRGTYTALWARSREEEKQQFEQVVDLFIGRLRQFPQMHVYHFGVYEPSRLKRLAGRHATREEEVDHLLRSRVFVDLHRVVRQGLRAGVESYSIKKLEPLYGYERQIDLREAGDSIVEFELWLDGWLEEGISDEKILGDIEQYNRDDCVSTQRLRDWLEYELRPRAAQRFGGELPRPPTEIQPTSEEMTARQAAVRALEERLTASLPKDPTEQSTADQATWLLAHLIDWHRRENKASWWRFYDLLTRSDDELFEEAEPIAGLDFIEMWPKGGRAKSDIYRYRYPRQEHKVEVGNEAHDPRLTGNETSTGEVVAVDKDAGTIEIRRLQTWSGEHPTAIVPLNIYRAPKQQDALMRFGEWVAANGIDTESQEWRAARELLRRLPPRLIGAEGGALVRAAESGTEAAQRLALALDGTTLAIQGPPGSGKTWTGARMIVDLVAAGRKVGITSNSHKVISNLLGQACDAARERGQALRAMQKADGEDGCQDAFVECVDDNARVEKALVEGEVDVVGGTAWLWARPELAGLVDTLFVDEAGQVSLANVVAISGAARNIVLLGDPQQLDQPVQGAHPPGAERSALAHFLGESETVPPERGIFFEKTWRLHPDICSYTSDLFYEARLEPVDGLGRQRVEGADGDRLAGSGLRWVPVEHDARTNEAPEEAEVVAEIWRSLVGRTWIDRGGNVCPLTPNDILIISPFNAHRLLIQERLGPTARVGTVDKFQGQEAPVSIYTMATSRPEDAPRGMGFLYSLNRLNVATSRAQALAIVVASPALLAAVPRTPNQLHMANGLCAFVEEASGSRPRG